MRPWGIVWIVSCCVVLAFSAVSFAQPAPEIPPGPAAPATQPAFPLWDGKETIAAYARRAGIKKIEVVLDLGKGIPLKATLIPAGKFKMGASQQEVDEAKNSKLKGDPNANALPQHEVTITRPFYMGIVTVTQEQYQQVTGKNPSTTKNPKNPVETIPWDDAVDFAKKVSEKSGKTVRLATEAEWEYACRAGSTTPFYTGETISVDLANYDGSAAPYGKGVKGVYRNKILPAGSFRPNAWGLYDMAGNVAQWVADRYSKDYYAASPATDPTGPETGTMRAQRGGGFGYSPILCRSASRSGEEPSRPPAWLAWTGFRVVVELEPQKK